MDAATRHRVSYFLVVTGFAASLALHLASFWAPGIAEFGLPIGLVYAIVILFKNLTSLRRRPFRSAPGSDPPAAPIPTRPGVGRPGSPPGEVPPWTRWV